MREIKFRAWDGKEKRMVFNSSSHSDNSMYYPWGFQLNRIASRNDLIFMQYIGLKDKNGVEIYEGDIVIHEDGILNSVSKIVFNMGGFTTIDIDCIMARPASNQCLPVYHKDMKVIGNIYQNKDLLNG